MIDQKRRNSVSLSVGSALSAHICNTPTRVCSVTADVGGLSIVIIDDRSVIGGVIGCVLEQFVCEQTAEVGGAQKRETDTFFSSFSSD